MKGNTNRGVAQLASASGLGPEGPVFESQYPDIQAKKLTDKVGFFLFVVIMHFRYNWVMMPKIVGESIYK